MPENGSTERPVSERDYGMPPWDPQVIDRETTGRVRCIGCGKFVAEGRRWNQCPDCDTREPEERS